MVKDHISPEERLLALIRGKHRKAEPGPEPKEKDERETEAPKAPGAKLSLRKPKLIRAGEIFKAGFLKPKFLEPACLRGLNRYMAVLAVLFMAYLFIDIIFIKPDKEIVAPVAKEPESGKQAPNHSPAPLALRASGTGSGSGQAPAIRDYSFYSTEIAQKNIFGQAEQESAQAQSVMAAEDVAGNISLVGIIAGDNPQAVLEDKKSQKTYYMTKGESFNGFTVEEISQGKVVLDYQGKKFALSL
jgi:hypothetical protein